MYQNIASMVLTSLDLVLFWESRSSEGTGIEPDSVHRPEEGQQEKSTCGNNNWVIHHTNITYINKGESSGMFWRGQIVWGRAKYLCGESQIVQRNHFFPCNVIRCNAKIVNCLEGAK